MRLKPSVRDLITVGCVIIGSLLCAININTFINAGGLFPGGFTGLTVFIQRCAEKYMNLQVPYSAVNFALNAIPAYIGYKTVGKKFTLYSCVMIVLTGVFVEILPVTNITEDILLITAGMPAAAERISSPCGFHKGPISQPGIISWL